jgi:ubiquinone/menaquinone biosynthesis C-methylase UbiE
MSKDTKRTFQKAINQLPVRSHIVRQTRDITALKEKLNMVHVANAQLMSLIQDLGSTPPQPRPSASRPDAPTLRKKVEQVLKKTVASLPVGSRIVKQSDQINNLQTRIARIEAANEQLVCVVRELGSVLPPPAHLQTRVAGAYDPNFIEVGRRVCNNLQAVLARQNKSLTSFGTLLDFGCGCGRVLRAVATVKSPAQKLFGTDIDAEAITWCKKNYQRIAEFGVNECLPPTSYADGSFDFIYSISIFTHLPEDMHHAWLAELKRISKPGGYLVLTTHGQKYSSHIPESHRRVIAEKGFLYLETAITEGLPDFYRTAFHTHDYIRKNWSKYFNIVDIQEASINENQDAIICQNAG